MPIYYKCYKNNQIICKYVEFLCQQIDHESSKNHYTENDSLSSATNLFGEIKL